MENMEKEAYAETTKKYISLMSTINETEKRLGWLDLVLLSLNIITVFFTTSFVSNLFHKAFHDLLTIDILLIFFCLVIGMAMCTYWAATSIRLQLKLKLRYFQARYFERKMGSPGEYIISDEALFFMPSIRRVESPDKKEHLHYPMEGLVRMDGFVGAAKQRHFSWFLPLIFFTAYCTIFAWTVFSLTLYI
jgi:hypothetical protein